MRIVACGDALFSSRNLARRLDRGLVRTMVEADIGFVNAEFCCPERTTPPAPRRFITAVRPEVLDEFVDLNLRMVSFANNHTGDFGQQGVIDTIRAAEARGLLPGGIGYSLEEARAPRFLDTPTGRVAFIAAGTTRAADFAASSPGKGVEPRPGLNPLRFGRAYVLADEDYTALRRIDERLGTAASWREVAAIEVMPEAGPDRFNFGSVFEGSLQIERGAETGIRYFANPADQQAILANVSDAANRADQVIVSLHAHEGTHENWYSPRAAPFIESFCRQAIDAGASAVFGHGPHMLRGIELYRGKPIFYSLGSLLMEFETGEQRMTPEMYASYGFDHDALPSDLHRSRVSDKSGRRIGFYGDRRFSMSCIALCDVEGDRWTIQLVPIDLDLNRSRPAERGVPYPASAEAAREIAEHVAVLSAPYGTRITYDAERHIMAVHAS